MDAGACHPHRPEGSDGTHRLGYPEVFRELHLKFKKIEMENGIYYGLMNFKNTSWIKTQINENNIDKVQLNDKALSTILTVVVPLAVLIGVVALLSSNQSRTLRLDIDIPGY